MCCGIPVHYQLGILNFYPSRSYGIYEFDVAEDDSMFLTDARVESEFIGYCCTLPSVESITGFVAYAEKNKFIFGFLDDKYDVAFKVPYEMNSSNGVSMFIFDPVVHRLLFDPFIDPLDSPIDPDGSISTTLAPSDLDEQ
ncbi:hypothetical protein T05_10276 [Trichinella murrelli]|uniref:Uncharacterized protein n=1 Tax=Trichinella murrelli TaxID=144512 RepID=A0A0V0TBC3_9BILA|nr:hypothetical protein T05_10276 [Trichinella murrelli]